MKRITVMQLTTVGLMAALVFISSRFSIYIPLAVGNTRLHLGNVFCVLSGLLLGAGLGGMAAGIGSMLFDLFDPIYVSSAPFTLVFKFLLAFVVGKIAYSGGCSATNIKRNIVAGILGSLTYVVLYLIKSFLENVLFLQMPIPGALAIVGQKGMISTINAVLAVTVSIPLGFAIKKGLDKSNLRIQ